jgi:hypothetical protein
MILLQTSTFLSATPETLSTSIDKVDDEGRMVEKLCKVEERT